MLPNFDSTVYYINSQCKYNIKKKKIDFEFIYVLGRVLTFDITLVLSM